MNGPNKQRMVLQTHPDYGLGFEDAAEGEPLLSGMGRPYLAGWFGFYKAKRIFETHFEERS